jgi:hypothetical protein
MSLSSFIWLVADLPRGGYKQSEYGKVILPFPIEHLNHYPRNPPVQAEIDEDAWATPRSDTSRAFDKPESRRIAIKVINQLGDEVMNIFRVTP